MSLASAPAFLFDPNKCTGCQACEVACTIENGLEEMSWRRVSTFNEERRPDAPVIHLSLACNHCEDAPCMRHCPALAYSKDPATGFVNLDSERCIGCQYCSWACPYDAPKFDQPGGVMTKCTFCGHRQAEGREPACVEGCPTGALGFGALDSLPGEPHATGFPTTEPGPSIRFMPWGGPPASSPNPPLPLNISLRSEWPLLGFTLMGALLVAFHSASVAGGVSLHPLAFMVPAAASMGLSSLHLGQKRRAWRAILNIRRSWLSREIVLYSAFVGLASVHLLAGLLGPLAVALGFLALFAMDRVYDIVRPASSRYLHSADVVLTGAFLGSLLMGWTAPIVALAVVKSGLYLRRKLPLFRNLRPAGWGWSVLRLGSGLLPLVAVGAGLLPDWWAWVLAGTAVGEVIDRVEFYGELTR